MMMRRRRRQRSKAHRSSATPPARVSRRQQAAVASTRFPVASRASASSARLRATASPLRPMRAPCRRPARAPRDTTPAVQEIFPTRSLSKVCGQVLDRGSKSGWSCGGSFPGWHGEFPAASVPPSFSMDSLSFSLNRIVRAHYGPGFHCGSLFFYFSSAFALSGNSCDDPPTRNV